MTEAKLKIHVANRPSYLATQQTTLQSSVLLGLLVDKWLSRMLPHLPASAMILFRQTSSPKELQADGSDTTGMWLV